jgi:BirA family biotin operon repressor/biotin-[acetyl-CoA-carboxylase] ligase
MISFKKPICYAEVFSTQDIAKVFAKDRDGEGNLIVAYKQTKGRGRLQKEWSSPAGGLWFSFVLKPDCLPDKISPLSSLVGLVLCDAIKNICGIIPKIKWPNDILIDDKKVAGILVESSVCGDKLKWIVVGVGINTQNDAPQDLSYEAASLKNFICKPILNCILLKNFLDFFNNYYSLFIEKGFGQFVEKYNMHMAYLNEKIVLLETGRIGVNKGIDEAGHLIFDEAGKLERIPMASLRMY